MQELKTEETIERLKDMIIDFGDGLLEFETKDVNVLLNQLTLQENYNDMLVRELEDLKEQNNKQLPKEFAIGFAKWILCFYNTSEEGMSLCWSDAESKTKHDTNELFDIYLKTLK